MIILLHAHACNCDCISLPVSCGCVDARETPLSLMHPKLQMRHVESEPTGFFASQPRYVREAQLHSTCRLKCNRRQRPRGSVLVAAAARKEGKHRKGTSGKPKKAGNRKPSQGVPAPKSSKKSELAAAESQSLTGPLKVHRITLKHYFEEIVHQGVITAHRLCMRHALRRIAMYI